MQSADMRSIEAASAQGHALKSQTVPATISTRWLVRRAALWMLIVTLGVSGACLLYTAASKAEADSITRTEAVRAHPASPEPAISQPASARIRG